MLGPAYQKVQMSNLMNGEANQAMLLTFALDASQVNDVFGNWEDTR